MSWRASAGSYPPCRSSAGCPGLISNRAGPARNVCGGHNAHRCRRSGQRMQPGAAVRLHKVRTVEAGKPDLFLANQMRIDPKFDLERNWQLPEFAARAPLPLPCPSLSGRSKRASFRSSGKPRAARNRNASDQRSDVSRARGVVETQLEELESSRTARQVGPLRRDSSLPIRTSRRMAHPEKGSTYAELAAHHSELSTLRASSRRCGVVSDQPRLRFAVTLSARVIQTAG